MKCKEAGSLKRIHVNKLSLSIRREAVLLAGCLLFSSFLIFCTGCGSTKDAYSYPESTFKKKGAAVQGKKERWLLEIGVNRTANIRPILRELKSYSEFSEINIRDFEMERVPFTMRVPIEVESEPEVRQLRERLLQLRLSDWINAERLEDK